MHATSFRGTHFTCLNRLTENLVQRSLGLSLLFYLASLLVPGVALSAVPVQVTQAEFTIYGHLSYPSGPYPSTVWSNYTTSLVANSPISEYVERYESGYTPTGDPYRDQFFHIYAGAASDWFQVSVATGEGSQDGYAEAYVISEITFSPISTSVGDLTINTGPERFWNAGFASLLDVTLNHPMWLWYFVSYYVPQWAGRPEPYLTYDTKGTLSTNGWPYLAPVVQETALTEGHEYRLVTYVECNAYGDSEEAFMNVLGVQIVPEPSSRTLLGLGSLALATWRRRR